jgi:tetratricopeptide (TPR) repeat protein
LKAADHISFEKVKALAENQLSAKEAETLRQKIKGEEKWEPIYQGLLQFSEQENEPIDDYLKRESQKIRPSTKNPKLKRLFWAISSVAAVMVFALWVTKPWQPDFSKIDFHDAGLPTTLSSSDNSTFNQGMLSFKQQKFKAALQLFGKVSESEIGTDTLLYFRASCQKQLCEYKEALAIYQKIDQHSFYYQKAEYQIALCFAFEGETEKAINGFKAIAQNQKHPFSGKAKNALKVLN